MEYFYAPTLAAFLKIDNIRLKQKEQSVYLKGGNEWKCQIELNRVVRDAIDGCFEKIYFEIHWNIGSFFPPLVVSSLQQPVRIVVVNARHADWPPWRCSTGVTEGPKCISYNSTANCYYEMNVVLYFVYFGNKCHEKTQTIDVLVHQCLCLSFKNSMHSVVKNSFMQSK